MLKFQTDKDHGYAGLDGLHTSEYPVVRSESLLLPPACICMVDHQRLAALVMTAQLRGLSFSCLPAGRLDASLRTVRGSMLGTAVAQRLHSSAALRQHGFLECRRSCRPSPTAQGVSSQTDSGLEYSVARVPAGPIQLAWSAAHSMLMRHVMLRSGQPALTPPELSRLVCGYALLGHNSAEVAALLDAVAGTVVRRIKVRANPWLGLGYLYLVVFSLTHR